MRYFSLALFLAIVFFFALPYIRIYQLDKAITNNDTATLSQMVDLDSIRKIYKESVQKQMQGTLGVVGSVSGNNSQIETLSNIARIVGDVAGDTAVEKIVDVYWVRDRLRPKNKPADSTIMNSMSYAFYETPTRFTIRIGELGNNPTFVQLMLTDWSWRVTGIYE